MTRTTDGERATKKRSRVRRRLGALAVIGVVAAMWPVAGAAPLPLAATYLVPANCTKHALAGSHEWNSTAAWMEASVPGTSDVVCIPDGATVIYDHMSDTTVVGIVSDATNAPLGTAHLTMGPVAGGGTINLSGGASADKTSTIAHLDGEPDSTLNAAKTGALPTIIRFLDTCRIAGAADYVVTGGAGGNCSLSGTGTPVPTMTLSASMALDSWQITNRRVLIEAGKTVTVQAATNLTSNAKVENQGVVDFQSDVNWNAFDNTSSVQNDAGGVIKKTVAGFTGLSVLAAPVRNDGVIENDTLTGTLALGTGASYAPGTVEIGTFPDAPISGTGTFAPAVSHDRGPLAPGNSAGDVHVAGNYTMTNTAANPELAIEAGGTGPGQSDKLIAGGACTLQPSAFGPTLSVSLIGGYTPALGDAITIMSCAGGVSGTFITKNLPTLAPPLFFDVVYNPTTVVLVVHSTTAVTFRSFTAARSRHGVVLRWRTAAEADTLGFNVYRSRGDGRHRLNRHLIASGGAVGGGAYSFLDRRAGNRGDLRYWLQIVDSHGGKVWHGPTQPRQR